jgi:hypothetical protein
MAVQADIKKFLPSTYLQTKGKNVPALLAAINATAEKLEQLVQACIDQLFIQTASGRYLIQLGEQDGFTMPANSGLDIRAYSVLTPIMVADPKQVRQTIDELIQAFYSTDRTRAALASSVFGPYDLRDGDDLVIQTESGEVTIAVSAAQVSNIHSVSASEIAAIVNSLQGPVTAQPFTDRATSLDGLQISSLTSGVSSKIRVIGGKLQNVLKFPNVIGTQAATSTTWNITKDFAYTDVTRFTWDGAGTNPNVYLAKAGDFVTIRGLVDGGAPFSLLNGSYQLVDVGYDYFVIRNSAFTTLSSTLVQNLDNNIVFTSQAFIGLYNRTEYAFTSETQINTITMTVPAVPPLGRRFLAGSGHLHGIQPNVVDFTRNTITILMPLHADVPKGVNSFLLKNNKMHYDFRHGYYATADVNGNEITPTYTMDPAGAALLPFTIAEPIGVDPIHGTPGSADLILTFPFPHGLEKGWGFTLSGCTGSGNILAADLNTEHEVAAVLNAKQIVFQVRDADGSPKAYSGAPFGPVDVYQYASAQADGADFYMQFGTSLQAEAMPLGTNFAFDFSSGADVVPYVALQVRRRQGTVAGINGDLVDFNCGFGTGPNGLIMTAVTGGRTAAFGGSPSYYLDKTSALNQANVMVGLQALFLGFTPSSNPAFIGTYMYDPIGDQTSVTVSKYVVNTVQPLLKGDNLTALQIDTAVLADGEAFPPSGILVLDYGNGQFEGPIRYFAVVENPGFNQILIDPAYKFKNAHDAGAPVQFVHSNQPFTPDLLGAALPMYLTGTSQARDTMFVLAAELVASGIFVEQDVLLPDLRYVDTEIVPFA